MNRYSKAAEQGNARAKANIEALSQVHGTIQSVASTLTASEKGNPPRVLMPGGVVAPRPIYEPEPEYSDAARKAGSTGLVLLSLVVGPEGQPRNIKVLASLVDGLDEKAVDAVKTWKFEPETKDGKPVAVQLKIEVAFRLYESGVGRVEVVGDPQDVSSGPYLFPIIREADECWNNLPEDKTRAPSIKQGQLTILVAVKKDGRVGATEIVSSSGDGRLDRGARDCVASLKTDAPFPVEFKGKDLMVLRMQLLHNTRMSLTLGDPRIAAGGRAQFYVEMAGIASKTADWSVTGVGCTGAACGTVSSPTVCTPRPMSCPSLPSYE